MDLRETNFGIEIETIRRTREQVARAIHSVVGGEVRHVGTPVCHDPWQVTDQKGRVWSVVADGSLTNVASHLRAEVVSPVLTYEDIPELQNVVRAVFKCGSRCDETCSVHVHTDGTAFNGKTLANLAKMVYKQEALIHAALSVSPARLQRYTRPVSDDLIAKIERHHPKTKDQFNRLWYGHLNRTPERYHSSRYAGVNLNSLWVRGSIEFRWAAGTLHAGKIKAYIQFCLAIVAKALNGRAASSKKREFDPQSARYDFRTWLLRLGLIGDEFKTARKHLLASLPGDSAFKRGRPKPEAKKGWAESDADGKDGPNRDAVPVLVGASEEQATIANLGGES